MQSKVNSIFERKIRFFDLILYGIVYIFSTFVFLLVLYFVLYIFANSRLSFSFITSAPNPIDKTIGILPSIINTFYIILLSIIIAVPLGVGGAIYINEYAKNKSFVRIIEFTTETLSGIPSIIFGVFGYIFFCVLMNLKVSLLSGALTLTIMVLPTIIRTTQEALKAVPKSYRDGAIGIGATKWYMIRTILLPSAKGGIITAIILSVGRIIGESAALILVAGGSAMYMPRGNFFEQVMGSGATLSVELYRYAYSRGENEVGFSIASILLVVVIVLNVSIKLLSSKTDRGTK